MSKLFKKEGELQLINGGYLSDSDNNSVTHSAFVKAQQRAHRLATIAAAMKGKTFTATKAEDINALVAQVDAQLNATKVEQFVTVPKVSKGKVTTALAAEALAFINDGEAAADAENINERMQEFCIISEFETNGLFFKKGITKLEKIYTVKEITAAAKTVYAVLS